MADVRYAQICTYVGGEVKRYKLGKKAQREGVTSGVGGGWVGVRNKYFLIALVPDQQMGWEGEVSVGNSSEKQALDSEFYIVGDDEGSGETTVHLYLGPIEHARLRQLGMGLEYVMDLGWPVVRHVARVMLPLFLGLHRVFPNYGLVIIVFSVLVKVVVHPLTRKTYAASAKMQKIQPEMAALREQYKDDPQELNKQTMKLMLGLRITEQSLAKLRSANIPADVISGLEKLKDSEYVGEKAFVTAVESAIGKQKAGRYREQILKHAKRTRMNPMGGCLPMLVQMPVFFALYQVLSTTIELRQAQFVWWLTDLSQPDPWKVLPILMGLTSFVQQKMMMKDPKQKAMVYVMPVFMTFIFLRFASGLVLYWTMFNVLSMGEQALVEFRKKPVAETQ
jgi:YidC/Oxa1 family membrane protein insertase